MNAIITTLLLYNNNTAIIYAIILFIANFDTWNLTWIIITKFLMQGGI